MRLGYGVFERILDPIRLQNFHIRTLEMARSKIFQARTAHSPQHSVQISPRAILPSEAKYLLRLLGLLWNMIG